MIKDEKNWPGAEPLPHWSHPTLYVISLIRKHVLVHASVQLLSRTKGTNFNTYGHGSHCCLRLITLPHDYQFFIIFVICMLFDQPTHGEVYGRAQYGFCEELLGSQNMSRLPYWPLTMIFTMDIAPLRSWSYGQPRTVRSIKIRPSLRFYIIQRGALEMSSKKFSTNAW